jgi:hypothetical protein
MDPAVGGVSGADVVGSAGGVAAPILVDETRRVGING